MRVNVFYVLPFFGALARVCVCVCVGISGEKGTPMDWLDKMAPNGGMGRRVRKLDLLSVNGVSYILALVFLNPNGLSDG